MLTWIKNLFGFQTDNKSAQDQGLKPKAVEQQAPPKPVMKTKQELKEMSVGTEFKHANRQFRKIGDDAFQDINLLITYGLLALMAFDETGSDAGNEYPEVTDEVESSCCQDDPSVECHEIDNSEVQFGEQEAKTERIPMSNSGAPSYDTGSDISHSSNSDSSYASDDSCADGGF